MFLLRLLIQLLKAAQKFISELSVYYFQCLHYSSYEHIILQILFIIDKEMLPTTCVALFLVVHIIPIDATVFNSIFAIQTNDYPKSSCHKISNITSTSTCLGTCVITVDRIVMISHDKSTNTCMCCNDITGSDITGPNWKSYVPSTCKYFIIF